MNEQERNSKIETKKLVDVLSEIKKNKDILDREAKKVELELQSRGIQILEDKNIKSISLKGTESTVTVTLVQKLNITNIQRLKETFNKDLAELKIKLKEKEPEYSVDTDFKKALTHLYTKDYEDKVGLEELLNNEFSNELPNKSKVILMKKLKGEYDTDKKLLESMFGEEIASSLEEELYYIYKIKNYERIMKYFNKSEIETIQKEMQQSVEVQEIPKLTLKV